MIRAGYRNRSIMHCKECEWLEFSIMGWCVSRRGRSDEERDEKRKGSPVEGVADEVEVAIDPKDVELTAAMSGVLERAGVRGVDGGGARTRGSRVARGEAKGWGGDGRQERGREGLGFKAGRETRGEGRETERKDAERGARETRGKARIERTRGGRRRRK
ncbi:hypothetical protein Syun_027673 [Stephania yunnanensis]|uniref:Uncharacterized protein n=1 Tax=Stephania yunnanensis TaxID=152371 RepID=A0AAP0EL42_9MAGN